MKLKKLLKDVHNAQVKGSKDVEITGVCLNSNLVSPGNLFIAKRGHNDDGTRYIPQAIAAGASAVLTDIYDPSLKDVVQVIHSDPSKAGAFIAACFHDFPSQDLYMVGITGTNGKTTSSFLVKHLLDRLNLPCGLIGTIEYIVGEQRYHATRTTPDAASNQKMLREMVSKGCHAAVMEVTSHALDQERVDHIDFDAALFTNLTLDHLDYHQTMDHYAAAKNKLFRSMNSSKEKRLLDKKICPKVAIVNRDSPWCERMLEGCQVPIITYGIHFPADLQASNILLTSTGTVLDLHFNGKSETLKIPLIGRFNVYNALGAIAVGLSRGEPLSKIVSIMSSSPSVSGRLEPVPNHLGLNIYVDFAHSPDALINVLETLQELKKGRLITVFGCGGDRDRTKRPKMAEAVESYSDLAIVTSDNPRSEDPMSICEEIIRGFKNKNCYMVEIDRALAIQKAISMANPEDIILLAGKGHEPYQIFAHKTVEFDDRKVAAQLCEK
jgi:UDP-N-acetylmuramoyl-L-alanyl-D-glutamate--2,6-diaminopimelate ligase